ncbi:sulfotransferase domain-containing protein [Paracoccus spongiarum]|uniref:Sulfotransferase domain-containing protein n=1 Tax=Paracoccus spongiarum TaxID=3064387 RepID=A0ABT9JD42_9RHOB|nr:sulfotransferase domain-containing protein [Paracoccus sp. 2205BS29-5]MDP5307545.1 sulfotransferase domain-containing protein [Paracoccus sp. 2205BS29-5]
MPATGKSILCATMHKAGSSIADLILADICRAKGLEIDRIALQVPSSDMTEGELFVSYQDKMRGEGVYYGVARGAYVKDMPIVYGLRAIIQVRDPRDCLTSAYFSFRESHRPPTDPQKLEAFLKRRELLQNQTIDEYATLQARSYNHRMAVLQEIVRKHDDVLVLRYEDMVTRTDKWLAAISDFIGQPITPDLRAILGKKIDFTVETEDASRHKRQVSPGDHRRKLKPETIASISDTLAAQLEFFDYEV